VTFAETSPAQTVTSNNFGETDAGKWKIVQLNFSQLLSLLAGTVLPLVLWELVHFGVLTRLVGDEAYLRHVRQRIKFILDDGSGVGLRTHSGPDFFWDKFFMLEEVAHPQRWVTAILFAVILAGGLILLWIWRARPGKHNLLAPIWLGWLANTAWFVGLAKTGWPRHYWFGLVLTIILLSVIPVVFWQHGLQDLGHALARKWSSIAWLALGTGVIFLIGWGFISQPYVWGVLLPDQIVPYWQDKQINNKYESSLPWIIIPRQAQTEVANYIKKMPPEANVYYPGQHKGAEIPPQTGRIHYPLKRRDYLEPHPADIALIGPSMISPWQDSVRRRDVLQLVAQQCPRPALVNDYYMICPIADNLPEQ